MNPFEIGKKVGQLEKVAKDAEDLLTIFTTEDVDKNGVPDGIQILGLLQKLPPLIQQKTPEAEEEVKEIFREIARLVGDDITDIQVKAKAELEELQQHIEALRSK